jgi:hypothetical protein
LGRGEGLTYDAEEITEPGLNHYRNKEKSNLLGMSKAAMDGYGKNGEKPDALLFSSKSQNRLNEIMAEGKPVKQPVAPQENLFGDVLLPKESDGMIGTSIFDPVLCELAYRWFCPPKGVVLDPFAGGSVRGIVASKMGHPYLGVDLSAPQVAANMDQALTICDDPAPTWFSGDSREIEILAAGLRADFIFTCPPYADLEVYSDDVRDISTLAYPEFRTALANIIAAACRLLKPDRFACIVVGDVRGKDGCYYGLPWHTMDCFEKAGLKIYNEAVLVTAVGSLPIRAKRQFDAGRKLGKTHQNFIVAVKGDPKKAAQACNGEG